MESYQRLIDVIALENLQMRAEYWVLTQVLVLSTLWQITAVLAALLVARILSRLPKAWLARRIAGLHMSNRFALGILAAALSILGPLVALILVLAEIFVARSFAWPSLLLSMTANLLVAWIFIRLLSSLIQSSFWSRAIAVQSIVVGLALSGIAMVVAAFGYLTPVAGAVLQEGIDVAVILNALRALGGGSTGQKA